MARPLPVDYLQPEETIVHQGGRHGLSVLDEIIGVTILAAFPIAGVLVLTLGFFPDWFLPLAVPVIGTTIVAWAGFLLSRYWRVTTTQHTITDERVYYAYGRLRFNISQTTYDKLTDIHVRQGIFGRIYGFGTLRLETAGTGIALHGVRDPFGTKQIVEDRRAAFIRSLVDQKAPTPITSDDAPVEKVQQQATIWSSRPSPASLIGNFVSVGLLVLFFLGGGVGAFATFGTTGGWSLLVPAVLLFIALSITASTIIRFRFTTYEIGTKGVVVTRGWLTRQRVETTYTKVTDVTVYQGILGRLLDFGNITVNTAGSNNAPVVFVGVPRPEQVKLIIDEQRDR